MTNYSPKSFNRNFCEIKRSKNRIIITMGPNTKLTSVRNLISNNSKKIKEMQKKIREDIKIKKTKRLREKSIVNKLRDEEIFKLSKLTKKEIYSLLTHEGDKAPTNYKDILIARYINRNYYQPYKLFGEIIHPKQITSDNVRKIIQRQKDLILNKNKKL
jgi:predicted metal-dependent hydrolase